MRTIDVSEVTALVRKLCIDANYYLPADLRQAFVDGQQSEQSPLGREIFGEMIANCDLARENNVPVCQDTGMAIVFAEIGQDVHLTGGSFEDAVTEGVRRGYIDGYLRLSVVGDPLRRENTNDNTPCILYTSMVPGDRVKITVAPKGFGSENMTKMKMFTPAATQEQIIDFIADACIGAGSNPCPPIVIGVGLGGELGTGEDGRDRLFPGHGGAARNILRAVGNFPIQHCFLLDIGIDAHIADGDAAAEMFRKNACAGFSTGQVHRLHQRHGLGGTGHALRHHAVVGGKYQKMGLLHFIMHLPGDARQLDGQVFQPPQTSGGLCKLRLTLPRLFHSGVIQRGNGGKQFVQFFFHVHPSKIRSSSIQLTAGAA